MCALRDAWRNALRDAWRNAWHDAWRNAWRDGLYVMSVSYARDKV